MKNNIIFVGMMGAGKTTIAKLLKEKLPDFKLVDVDEEIEKQEALPISKMFIAYGETYFRSLETKMIQDVCEDENQIISIGGGAFESEINRKMLKNNGLTIYLKASPSELFNRIKSQTHRPLLKTGFNETNVKEILENREKNYLLADITIDTNSKPFYNIIEEILERIKNVL